LDGARQFFFADGIRNERNGANKAERTRQGKRNGANKAENEILAGFAWIIPKKCVSLQTGYSGGD